MSVILTLITSYFLIFFCLSYNCWYYKRKTDTDYFLSLLPFCLNCIIVYNGQKTFPLLLVLIVGSILSTFISEIFIYYYSRLKHKSLALILLASTIGLLFFDWHTEHKTISISQYETLNTIVPIIGLLNIVWTYYLQKSRLGTEVKLGIKNKWAINYWFEQKNIKWYPYYVIQTINWFVITYILLSGTGVTSSTILKFTLFAILIAEICDIRGVKIILLLSFCLAIIRILIPFYISNKLAPVAVEVTVFCLLFFYIGFLKSRSKLFLRDAD